MDTEMACMEKVAHANGMAAYTPKKESDAHADVFWAKDFPDLDKPCLSGKGSIRVVLVGAQGTGKSTLFNKLTGSSAETSSGIQTCTRTNEWKTCLAPFGNVEIGDTPGTATDDVHYDDSFQLREAFIRKPVNLIALVCGLPAVNRVSEVITSLKPMDKIMKSSTFTLDVHGVVTPPKSSSRTRVLLVLTHRDRFSVPKEEWNKYILSIRGHYDWVGSVVMIDREVPINNLLGAIILPATCMSSRDYNIPMAEFCSRFPISRVLSNEEELTIMDKLVQFNTGMSLAILKFQEINKERQKSGYCGSSSYVDKIGPSMDCILRFLDDLYERTTLEAVAVLERVQVDELWIGTDEDINVKRVEKWNAVKAKFGEGYERSKQLINNAFPTQPIDAIYKKCNHCGIVYVKPTGCDFGTTCGESKGGKDSLPYTYEYVESKSFEIRENSVMGMFEQCAYKLRKNFSEMVYKNTTRFYGARDSGAVVQEHNLKKKEMGCRRGIKWETMIPLTIEELQRHNLIPEGVNYAATTTETAGVSKKDMSLPIKMKAVAQELGLDTNKNMACQVKEANAMMGIEEPGKSLAEQVNNLYDMCIC